MRSCIPNLITSKFVIFVDPGGNEEGIHAFFAGRGPLITSKFAMSADLGGNAGRIHALCNDSRPHVNPASATEFAPPIPPENSQYSPIRVVIEELSGLEAHLPHHCADAF